MSQRVDLTGRRFGNLVVLAPAPGRGRRKRRAWKCRCDCGQETDVISESLTSGNTRSCGHTGRSRLAGQRFGRLIAIRDVGSRQGNRLWECVCDCGERTNVIAANLRGGHTRSCGCLRSENHKTHGLSKNADGEIARLYGVWRSMKARCFSPKSKSYSSYGGRGITVCPEWAGDYKCFHDWAMANGYRPGLTLDRVDNDGGYDPGNCRWVTDKRQARNRRSSRTITFRGRTLTAAGWEDITGIASGTIRYRLEAGWPVDRALTEPVNQKTA